MQLSESAIEEFRDHVWEYYRAHGRSMPWRDQPNSYYVLVSELMLQQTQVSRVIPKFEEFITRFPDIASLAVAPLAAVVVAWSGLGYNRRARFLHEAAWCVMERYSGRLPDEFAELLQLPGIGRNTAGAILAYAFNQPAAFVETNVRTVYFHHFFPNRAAVTDREILALVEQTIDSEHPREWYWAMMDYGSHLKSQGLGQIDKSHHYRKQSNFAGSLRQMRGRILRELHDGARRYEELATQLDDERFEPAFDGLVADRLVYREGEMVCLTGAHQDPHNG